jgi:hypothetical protein
VADVLDMARVATRPARGAVASGAADEQVVAASSFQDAGSTATEQAIGGVAADDPVSTIGAPERADVVEVNLLDRAVVAPGDHMPAVDVDPDRVAVDLEGELIGAAATEDPGVQPVGVDVGRIECEPVGAAAAIHVGYAVGEDRRVIAGPQPDLGRTGTAGCRSWRSCGRCRRCCACSARADAQAGSRRSRG